MDLATLDTAAESAGADLTLLHPASGVAIIGDDKKPVTITLLGSDSEVFRKATRKATNKRLNHRNKMKITAEELEAENIDLLAACTVAWHNVKVDGKKLDCTPANAAMLYERFRWIREQVDEFVGERANFLRTSSAT